MPKIKGLGISLQSKMDMYDRAGFNPSDVDKALGVDIQIQQEEQSPLLFEETVSYKVRSSHIQTKFHDTEITDEMAHNQIIGFIRDNGYEKVIEILREKNSLNRYVRDEYYAYNELIQDLYEQDFDIVEILGAIIVEYQLSDPELKLMIHYLVESNKHILREEMSDKFKGHTKKELSLFKFFTVK